LNINNVKNKVKEYQNMKLKIKVNLGRNKYEYLDGYIDKIHPNIFTIKTNKGIRSFSYSDVATNIVSISKF
jgi:uncharacterized protein Veg